MHGTNLKGRQLNVQNLALTADTVVEAQVGRFLCLCLILLLWVALSAAHTECHITHSTHSFAALSRRISKPTSSFTNTPSAKMIDHVLGRPSVKSRRLQVLAVLGFWSAYLFRYKSLFAFVFVLVIDSEVAR